MSFGDHWFTFPLFQFLDKSGTKVENKYRWIKRHWSEDEYWRDHNRNKYLESFKVAVGGLACAVGLVVYVFPTPIPIGIVLDVALTILGWAVYGLLYCCGCIPQTTMVQPFTPPGSDSEDEGDMANFPHLMMLAQMILNILQQEEEDEGHEMTEDFSAMPSDSDFGDGETSPLMP